MRLTKPLERVLRVFLEDVDARRYGYDLMKAAGVQSGTLYPMLARLEADGMVISDWEARREETGGRPPRRYYRLTGDGVLAARQELAKVTPVGSRVLGGWQPAAAGGGLA